MQNKGQLDGAYWPLVIGVVVVAGVLFIPIVDSGELATVAEQDFKEAQAYCEQVYGDESITNSMVVGNHGGWHCTANQNGPHLHAIPEEYKEQAYQAEQSGSALDWTVADARDHAEPTPWYQSMFGVVIVTAILAVLIGVAISLYGKVAGERESGMNS